MGDADKILLQKLAVMGRWYVDSDNLISAANLVAAGLATAWDDYEGMQLGATDYTVQEAKNLGIIALSEGGKGPYDFNEYTFSGDDWLDTVRLQSSVTS